MRIGPEEVGYWYLRLNGFLTTVNFVVHPDEGANQLTDIDVLGVRFPFRAELLREPMRDDDLLTQADGRPLIILTEIKKGRCQINRSLLHPQRDTLQRVLRALGPIPPDEVEGAVQEMRERGSHSSEAYQICFLCIGEELDPALQESHPDAIQITWNQVLSFIFNRFEAYRRRKGDHPQWDVVGHFLWNAAAHIRELPAFRTFVYNMWRAYDRG